MLKRLTIYAAVALVPTLGACSSTSSGGDGGWEAGGNSNAGSSNTAGGSGSGGSSAGATSPGGGPASGGSAPSGIAPQQCRAFRDAVCDRIVDCAIAAGQATEDERDVNMAACQSELDSALPCDRAVGVEDTYDECMADVAIIDCEAIVNDEDYLPVSCNGVILTDQ